MNNPPAFPCQNLFADNPDHDAVSTQIRESSGMTLRDYAAIAMMQRISRIPREHTTILEDVELAFQYADMFLKVREK